MRRRHFFLVRGVFLLVAAGPMDVVGRQFLEEAARLVRDDFAEALAPFRVRQRKIFLGARDADLEQAAFLFDRLAIRPMAQGVGNRKRAVDQPDQIHRIPFQTLRRVQ